jgi:hypothetical protein
MTEIKPLEPSTIPEPDEAIRNLSATAFDPSQTRMLPQKAAVAEHELDNKTAMDADHAGFLKTESKPVNKLVDWFQKLSQAAIMWTSLSIILILLVIFVTLIMQGRQKSKFAKSAATEPLSDAGEIDNGDAESISNNRLFLKTGKPVVVLTDDEFAGRAPMTIKASGPLISAEIDPELAAMVDALKIRLEILENGKSTTRGNSTTTVTKGEYRGFKINIDEKKENQNTVSKEITIITPKKGLIKTINSVLESIKDSNLERFSVELQDAGLEIIKLPLQPENKVFQVQLKSVRLFEKPIAPDLLISGKSVGKIYLGMPTIQLETMLLSSYIILKRKVLVNDIYYDVYKILDQSNEPLFFVYENKGRIWGISIISEMYKTEKGIGINSSLGNMRINYPRVHVGISEKKTPFVKIDGVDGLFTIQGEGVNFLKNVFPNKTSIISILIGNSPEFE